MHRQGCDSLNKRGHWQAVKWDSLGKTTGGVERVHEQLKRLNECLGTLVKGKGRKEESGVICRFLLERLVGGIVCQWLRRRVKTIWSISETLTISKRFSRALAMWIGNSEASYTRLRYGFDSDRCKGSQWSSVNKWTSQREYVKWKKKVRRRPRGNK